MLKISCFFLLSIFSPISAQTIQDSFEGNGNITTWFGDDCLLNTNFNNPQSTASNSSSKVLRYEDI